MSQYKTFSQAYALIIAIAEYKGRNALPEIVTKDANDIVSILTAERYCGYDELNVKKLLNSEATLSNIRNEIIELSNKAGMNDTVFIYFSGHGCNLNTVENPECALVPVDYDGSSGSMLLEEELSLLLSKIHSERLLFIIDACHSGGAATFKSSVNNQTSLLNFSDKSLEKLSQGKGRVLMASSRDSETSLLLRGDQNSLFTKHFLSALKGDAGSSSDSYICVFDIFSYLERMVPVEAKNVGEQQHPIFKSNLENNFPVALRCGGIIKQVVTFLDRKLEDILAELYPFGPSDQEIWQRAGGDISRIKLIGNGRAQWFSALRVLEQGGGGVNINMQTLLSEVKNDFPNYRDL